MSEISKIIFVTGGVCSSLGKGVASASIALLLKKAGYKVSIQKLDPYLNVDPGTMSPFQHGEVFVTDDGAETDLDLGHYERFIDESMNKYSSVSTGKVYSEVLERERKGDYLGSTIQVIPHITDTIKERVLLAKKESNTEILVVEIGGTIGDMEGGPFIEAIRQMRDDLGKDNVIYVHLTLLPFLQGSGELKTKPTQLSVRELLALGIQPDLLLCRADQDVPQEILAKISRFCNVEEKCVFPAPTIESIYEVPLNFEKKQMSEIIQEKLGLKVKTPDLKAWAETVDKILTTKEEIKIGLCGKYTELDDAYLSVIEALKAAGFDNDKKVKIEWLDAEKLEEKDEKEWGKAKSCAGICIPGGFGSRGTQGKIETAKYCRENEISCLGLCLGSQIMAIEFARNVCGIKGATSEEFEPDAKNKIVHFLPDQDEKRAKGGTLRLGAYPCIIKKETTAYKAYQTEEISERHRHRYEFNNEFRQILEEKGFAFSGLSPDNNLIEIVEITNHPFYLGSQFHPEFKSRPDKPHPMFREFIKASI